MSNIQWPMSNVHCPMSNYQSPMSNVHCPLSNVQCQISKVQCLMSNIHCPLSKPDGKMCNVQCPIFNVHCPMSIVPRPNLISKVQCLMSTVQCPMSNIQSPMSNVQCLISIYPCSNLMARCADCPTDSLSSSSHHSPVLFPFQIHFIFPDNLNFVLRRHWFSQYCIFRILELFLVLLTLAFVMRIRSTFGGGGDLQVVGVQEGTGPDLQRLTWQLLWFIMCSPMTLSKSIGWWKYKNGLTRSLTVCTRGRLSPLSVGNQRDSQRQPENQYFNVFFFLPGGHLKMI